MAPFAVVGVGVGVGEPESDAGEEIPEDRGTEEGVDVEDNADIQNRTGHQFV